MSSQKPYESAPRQDASVVSPDSGAAAEFLAWLDPESPSFTFQTFDDSADKRLELARVLNGWLDRHALELQRLQRAGAGVFVIINETDLLGRTTENIKRVRALFVDLDGAPLEQLGRFSLTPSCIVDSSPGRFHAYWLVEGVDLDAFKPLQQRLALLVGGDKAVCDLPRVMRLPGFLHQKGEPFLTTASLPTERLVYSRDEVVAALECAGSEAPGARPLATSPM